MSDEVKSLPEFDLETLNIDEAKRVNFTLNATLYLDKLLITVPYETIETVKATGQVDNDKFSFILTLDFLVECIEKMLEGRKQ
jgi:hypothetical protein